MTTERERSIRTEAHCCNFCLYFHSKGPGLGVSGVSQHDPVLIGECRAYPPERHSIFNRRRVWPLVCSEDWCGEYNNGEELENGATDVPV